MILDKFGYKLAILEHSILVPFVFLWSKELFGEKFDILLGLRMFEIYFC